MTDEEVESPNRIITMPGADVELHLPPGQTPITSAKRIARMRRVPATVGMLDDQIKALAEAMLVQYGPLSKVMIELMRRQQALEDYCTGVIDDEEMRRRIRSASAPDITPEPEATGTDG